MAKQSRPSRPADLPSAAAPPRVSRGVWIALIVAAALPIIVHLALFAFQVPLGKPGTITYPYSEFAADRAARLPQMVALAAMLAASVLLVTDARRGRRVLGYALAVAGTLGVGVWSLVSPPAWQRQQLFNMLSPSHDGAFFLEAPHVEELGVPAYVRTFAERAGTPPEEMRGTRVISNPPATTLLAVWVNRVLAANPDWMARLGSLAVDDPTLGSDVRIRAGRALGFSLSLMLLWLLGAVLIFSAALALVSPETALAIGLLAAVSPMTVLFSPGKDPAQLATLGAFLCLWVVALRCSGWIRGVAGAAAGLALAGGLFVGLVHAWIAVCVIPAAWVGVWRRRAPDGRFSRAWLALVMLGIGVVAGALLLYGCLGYDMIASTLAIAAAQANVTRGPTAMPLAWQALGVPLFLLFSGVGPLAAAGLAAGRTGLSGGSSDDRGARFGRALILVTLAVMVATLAFTNMETPRLWIPFAALLVFGGGLQLEPRLPRDARARILAALVAMQVVASGVQWTLMDMREAELRLRIDASGDARFFD